MVRERRRETGNGKLMLGGVEVQGKLVKESNFELSVHAEAWDARQAGASSWCRDRVALL